MHKKYYALVYRVIILQLFVWGFATGESSLIFLGLLNGLLAYFMIPELKQRIDTQAKTFFLEGLKLTHEQYTLVHHTTKYIFTHYIFIGSIIYLLLCAWDYLFANILFLSSWRGIFALVLSVLIGHQEILKGEFWIGARKLQRADSITIVSIVLLVTLLIFFRGLPFWQGYFYAIFIARISRIGGMLILKFIDLKKIAKSEIFRIGLLLSSIFFLIWVWNSFPGIKQSLTVQEVIYQSGVVYIDCPRDTGLDKYIRQKDQLGPIK